MTTVHCEHCNTKLEVSEHAFEVSEEYADGTIVCPDCMGREEYPEDVPECNIHDCEMPAPFTITTQNGEIHRCREDLRRELTGESWISWRFYRGESA